MDNVREYRGDVNRVVRDTYGQAFPSGCPLSVIRDKPIKTQQQVAAEEPPIKVKKTTAARGDGVKIKPKRQRKSKVYV